MTLGLGQGLQRRTIVGIGGGDNPDFSVPASIDGSPVVGQNLTVSYTVMGTATTITRNWYRGVTLIFTSTTSDVYTLAQADAGNTSNISCQVVLTPGGAVSISNTIAQIFDALANDVLNKIISVGGTTGTTVTNATNSHYIAIRSAGILAKLTWLRLNKGGTQNAVGVDCLVPASAGDTFAGGNSFSSAGLTTNGINSTRRTAYNVSSQPTNNQSCGWYISADCTGYMVGAGTLTDGSTVGRNAGTNYYGIFDTVVKTFTGNRRYNLAANRTGGNTSFIRDGVVVSTSAQAFAAKRSSLWITGALNTGIAPTITPLVYNANLYKYEWVGDSLSDAEVVTYQGLINQYMTDLGINNY